MLGRNGFEHNRQLCSLRVHDVLTHRSKLTVLLISRAPRLVARSVSEMTSKLSSGRVGSLLCPIDVT